MIADFNWTEAAGSPVMIALMICSVLAFGIAGERAWYFHKLKGDVSTIARNVCRLIRAGNLEEALRACQQVTHPFGPVTATLFSGSTDLESTDERLHVGLSRQKLLMERNLNVLGTLAAIAPLLGLLGTVWGIMRAFSDMARVGSAAPSVVAAGVSEALVTTAAGLVVAVPALILYNHFARRMNVMLTVAENESRSCRAELAVLNQPSDAKHSASAQNDSKKPAHEHATV